MAFVESIFDISYLSIVLALGVRLLVKKPKEAKLFGIMAIVLGLAISHFLSALYGRLLRLLSMNPQNKEYAKVSRICG